MGHIWFNLITLITPQKDPKEFMEKKVLTVEEVSKHFRVTPITIYNLINRGELPA